MTRKYALYALGVVVLMGSVAVAALADDQGLDMRDWGGSYSFGSAQPDQSGEPLTAGEIREPMETGAVPEGSGSSSDLSSNEPTVEIGGLSYRIGDLGH